MLQKSMDHAAQANGQTATPGPSSDGFGVRVLLYLMVFGLIIVTCLAGWRWVQFQFEKRTGEVRDQPVKALMVINALGDVVESNADQELIGRNVLLMMPANRRDETRLKMQREDRFAVNLGIGQTTLVKASDGLWFGVVR